MLYPKTKSNIILAVRKELRKNIDLPHRQGENRFFKGEIKNYGVRAAVVKKIAQKRFGQVKKLDKNQIFCLAETLLKSDYNEEAMIAFNWAFRLKESYQKTDFKTFENWLKKYVDNWAKCDVFCTHSFGALLLQFPQFMPRIKKIWTKSKNRWLRRGAAVILIHPIKYAANQEKWLSEVFQIADILLLDKDDLVQKGYGWLLKETANKYQKQVFDFVMKRKNKMPRTALRYAIEKMPQKMRHKAMAKP